MADSGIDIAALAIAAPAPPKGDKQKPPRKRPGEGYRARLTKEERAAIYRASAKRMVAAAQAKRGFTFEHRLATLMTPGVEYTTRDLWKVVEGRSKSQVSHGLRQMYDRGILARRLIPGAPETVQTIHRGTGKVMTWKPSKWLYSLTPKGEAYAAEGRLRAMLE